MHARHQVDRDPPPEELRLTRIRRSKRDTSVKTFMAYCTEWCPEFTAPSANCTNAKPLCCVGDSSGIVTRSTGPTCEKSSKRSTSLTSGAKFATCTDLSGDFSELPTTISQFLGPRCCWLGPARSGKSLLSLLLTVISALSTFSIPESLSTIAATISAHVFPPMAEALGHMTFIRGKSASSFSGTALFLSICLRKNASRLRLSSPR
mmetsp:Transcript_57781/g.135666  ORF Transcript_57781/g.135666 Transcript_57781/m.135666 type:complete len:206 (+) Transcript_57781:247-864(+)